MVFSISHMRGRLGHLRVLKAETGLSSLKNFVASDGPVLDPFARYYGLGFGR
jgi:hypothetical protein